MTRVSHLFAVPLFLLAAVGFSVAAQAGDVEHGKEIFSHTCTNCHSTHIGVNKVGPSLFDIVGRPTASLPDFEYSKPLRDLATTQPNWNEKAIEAYLSNPREEVHGVKMFFKGLPNDQDRLDVIAYLNTLK